MKHYNSEKHKDYTKITFAHPLLVLLLGSFLSILFQNSIAQNEIGIDDLVRGTHNLIQTIAQRDITRLERYSRDTNDIIRKVQNEKGIRRSTAKKVLTRRRQDLNKALEELKSKDNELQKNIAFLEEFRKSLQMPSSQEISRSSLETAHDHVDSFLRDYQAENPLADKEEVKQTAAQLLSKADELLQQPAPIPQPTPPPVAPPVTSAPPPQAAAPAPPPVPTPQTPPPAPTPQTTPQSTTPPPQPRTISPATIQGGARAIGQILGQTAQVQPAQAPTPQQTPAAQQQNAEEGTEIEEVEEVEG